MQPAQFGQAIIGHARQLSRLFRRAEQFQRRIGERQNLLVFAKLVEQPQPRIKAVAAGRSGASFRSRSK